MRIGFFSDFYLPRQDGVAYSIETFRTQLEAMGHEVFVFAPKPPGRHREKSDRIIRLPSLPNYFIHNARTGVFLPPLVQRKIGKQRLDLIHFHTPSPIGLLGAYVATKNNLPLVTTYHSDLYQYVSHYPALFPGVLALSLVAPLAVGSHAQDFETALSMMKPERKIETWNKKIVQRMMTVVHNRCDLILAPSHKIALQLKGWGTTPPIEVLPTGVDALPASDEAVAEFCQHYNISASDEVILFVGRLGSEKNVELLIHAFQLVWANRPQAKLMLVGDDKNRTQLQRLARSLGLAKRIIFTGYIERQQLGPAYRAAQVFAFPSRTDTQGLVIHEAAWAGLPIVMSDPLITEVVKHRVNGLIVRNDARHFARALIELLANPSRRQAMGGASQELAAQFSASNQATKLLRLYERLIQP